MFYDIVTPDTITNGRATDAYFERTEEALDHANHNPEVVAEITVDQFPTGEFEVFAGIKDVAVLLEGLPIEVDAIPEGQLFDGGPVMRITGKYLDFARWETAILGFLSHASGMATAALECTHAATDNDTGEETPVISFGSRHVHPALGAMVERSALVGGAAGFSNVAAGDALDRTASGTMPHALMLTFGEGNQEQAWRAFDEGVPEDIPRIALVDTFNDEVNEALRVAEELGDRLDGIRLDTTSSRRGDFRHIIKEVTYKLEAAGHSDIDIYVSGGIDPEDIRELREIVDGFGVGGYIVNADTVDFSLDIVEVDGEPISKRGKLPGVKNVYRRNTRSIGDGEHIVKSQGEATRESDRDLLQPLLREGNIVQEFDIDAAAERAWTDSKCVGFQDN